MNNKYQEIDNQNTSDFPKKFEGCIGLISIIDLSRMGTNQWSMIVET